ncbi:unnamed protein product [Boreogadus saida]
MSTTVLPFAIDAHPSACALSDGQASMLVTHRFRTHSILGCPAPRLTPSSLPSLSRPPCLQSHETHENFPALRTPALRFDAQRETRSVSKLRGHAQGP